MSIKSISQFSRDRSIVNRLHNSNQCGAGDVISDFEWDEDKRLANLRKHGIDFVDVPSIFDGDTVILEDVRYNYGEQRFVSFGLLAGRTIAVVHTEDDGLIRIISARKASKYEQQIYFEQV